MGFLKAVFGEKAGGADKRKGEQKPESIIESMMAIAAVCMENGRYDRAFETYMSIVEKKPEPDALYNLGSLCATGRGTKQDFLQAAYWFHQAELRGDQAAARLRKKSTMDYLHKDFDKKTPRELYQEMLRYGERLYPGKDSRAAAAEELWALGAYHYDRGEYGMSRKLFRSAAEFGDHGLSQSYLGVQYNLAQGVKGDDLTALYWFDRGSDNGVEAAIKNRDGILKGYRTVLGREEFSEYMEILAARCIEGTGDIPRDPQKAARWKEQSKEG